MTAFLSVGSKAAGFIVLTRVVEAFVVQGSVIGAEVQALLLMGGAFTVLFGSLPAIFQTNLKRLLAYSSISHAGYLLLALGCAQTARFDLGGSGIVAFYLGTYLPMTVLGFLILTVVRQAGLGDDAQDFAGLAKKNPFLAFAATLGFASLAGIPLTAGFMGKLFVFLGLVENAHWFALSCAVIGAAAGFYYYLKPVLVMFTGESGPALKISTANKAVLLVLVGAILVIGVFPKPLQGMLRAPVAAAVK